MLLVLASMVGVVAALAAWCFLELSHQIEVGVFDKLPGAARLRRRARLVAAAGDARSPALIVAFAIARLPGRAAATCPRTASSTDPTLPVDLPGVMLAGAGDDLRSASCSAPRRR